MNDHLSNEAWDGALVKELGKENMDIEYARVEKKKNISPSSNITLRDARLDV